MPRLALFLSLRSVCFFFVLWTPSIVLDAERADRMCLRTDPPRSFFAPPPQFCFWYFSLF